MWDLIVSVPDHCLSFYFIYVNFGICHKEDILPFMSPILGKVTLPIPIVV